MRAASDSCGFIICQPSDQEKWSKTLSRSLVRLSGIQYRFSAPGGPLWTCVREAPLHSPPCTLHINISHVNGAPHSSDGAYWCITNVKRNIYRVIDWPFPWSPFIKTIHILTRLYSPSASLSHTFIRTFTLMPPTVLYTVASNTY